MYAEHTYHLRICIEYAWWRFRCKELHAWTDPQPNLDQTYLVQESLSPGLGPIGFGLHRGRYHQEDTKLSGRLWKRILALAQSKVLQRQGLQV